MGCSFWGENRCTECFGVRECSSDWLVGSAEVLKSKSNISYILDLKMREDRHV
jgi:hypothetical protein